MPQSGFPRNVYVYDNSDDSRERIVVAGFMQLGRTTTAEFYACLEICFQMPRPNEFRLCDGNETVLDRNNAALIVPVGEYYVISLSKISSWLLLTDRRSLGIYRSYSNT